MAVILPKPTYFVKQRFFKRFQRCRQALVRMRYLIIINVWNGRSSWDIEQVLKVHNTTVYRVLKRFRQHGEASLWDGRQDNGTEKLSEHFLHLLDTVVHSNPQEHGWRRPTWTRETLVETMVRKTGVRIHVATMSRALALIRARRPIRVRAAVPVVSRSKNQAYQRSGAADRGVAARGSCRLRRRSGCPPEPQDWLGLDGLGQQKEAMTPGQNEKRYLAGAMDVARAKFTGWRPTRKTAGCFGTFCTS